MLWLRRGLETDGVGGGVQTSERAIHREISGKGSEVEKEAEAEMCLC